MNVPSDPPITDVIGSIPYRMAFAGGWIDQPFVSRLNPEPPGSMVVVGLEPTFRFMDRAGMATGTRQVAMRLWQGGLPDRDPAALVRELYAEENRGKPEPSGSQDMIGLIYPGVNRLDYDFAHQGGLFPRHIESSNDPAIARWLEEVIHMVPVAPRPEGYNPLGIKNLETDWIRRLGQTGKDCYDAILNRDLKGLGALDERVHGLLGNALAAHRSAPDHHCGPPGIAAPLPGEIPRSHVLRLRRRLPVHRLRNAGSRNVSHHGAPWLERRPNVNQVIVTGSFDDMRPRDVRFLQEATRLGSVHALLWSDEMVQRLTGKPAKFPQAERHYFVGAIRYVDRVTLCSDRDFLPRPQGHSRTLWAVKEEEEAFCQAHGFEYRVLRREELEGFPNETTDVSTSLRPRVMVTGCYDWFHSGHVRFFEEVSELGDLYVIVGHDANIKLLKGEGHPLFPEQERRYMCQSIRFVKQALISTGHGWLDAEPEIERLRPDVYAVNEDGDRPEKRHYCQAHGIDYRVLKRVPREGLPRRQSTDLRRILRD